MLPARSVSRAALGASAVLLVALLVSSPLTALGPPSPGDAPGCAAVLRERALALAAAHGRRGESEPYAGTLRFDFDDPARETVEFFPRAITDKRGATLGWMPLAERRATYALLDGVLSREGQLEVQRIASLEDVLRAEQLIGVARLADEYGVQLYGDPAAEGPWAMKYEGHHVSINATVVDGEVRATPLFLGANPVEIRRGPRAGQRAFRAHHELALALLEGLSEDNRARAHSPEPPPAGIVQRGAQPAPGAPIGAAFHDLDGASKQRLLELVRLFLRPLHPEVAEALFVRTVEEGLEGLCFHWQGGTGAFEPRAYRIQGPTLWIDFEVLRDGGQPDANHVHAILRDPSRDFGADLLRAHAAAEHR